MHTIADGIHRLGSKAHNFYVVTEGGKATVVDTGGSKEWPKVLQAIAAVGLTAGDIEAVVITHGHSDHRGGVKDAHAQGIPIRAHRDEEGRLTGTSSMKQLGPGDVPLWRPSVIAFMVTMLRVGAHRMPKIPSVDTFDDGEVLDIPGRPRGIHTPGHTEGHAAYWFEGRRTLFTGDALITRSLISRRRGPTILEDQFHTDHVQARQSLERLRGLDTELLLPGHGEPWRGSIDEAIDLALG